MSLSMFDASIPVYLRGLGSLKQVLERGEAHAVDRGFDPGVLLGMRLSPDMFPLTKQVQIATDLAKNGAARLADIEPPAFPDDETDFASLADRIDRAVGFLRGIEAAKVNGSEQRPVTLKTRTYGDLSLTGQNYLLEFSLPNFFFHCTTTYAILRHAGVELGKADFVQTLTTRD